MPTFDRADDFLRDYRMLSPQERALFRSAVRKFVHDLRSRRFRRSLRVRGVQGAEGVFEMTWAPDGRATFEYDAEVHPGEQHIIWRRIGGHDIFQNP